MFRLTLLAILPSYFTTVFQHVQSPPILRFPMPPIPPLIPRTNETFPLSESDSPIITNDPTNPFTEFMPAPDAEYLTAEDPKISVDSDSIQNGSQTSARQSVDSSVTASSSRSSRAQLGRSSSALFEEMRARYVPHKRHSVARLAPSDTTSLGNEEQASALFMIEKMQAMPSDNLFMHLYQAVNMVLSVREAMWDELKKRVDERDPELARYGWKEKDFDEVISRDKFDALVERYRGYVLRDFGAFILFADMHSSDMQVRMSLWYSWVSRVSTWHPSLIHGLCKCLGCYRDPDVANACVGDVAWDG